MIISLFVYHLRSKHELFHEMVRKNTCECGAGKDPYDFRFFWIFKIHITNQGFLYFFLVT